jgi:hemerythrin superfamily protein
MNALDFLKQQHKEVNVFFSQLSDEVDRELETEIVARLRKHANLEEGIFYPALQARKTTRDLIGHALEEHGEVKTKLSQWQRSDGKDWVTLSNEIKKSVQHHVKEEETAMFPQVEEAFTELELEDLGRRMELG